MKVMKILLCGLVLVAPVFAEEQEDRQTATSLKYVAYELDTRQDKLTAGQNKAIEYTDSAGDVTQRTVESDLSGANTSLPTVSAVTDGLSHKQDSIAPINDHTAVTYTGQAGTISTKGIYQTSGTYAEQSDNLIDAKTFNAALKNGLDSEFVCGGNKPGTDLCWLWEIHTTGTNSMLPPGYTQLEYIASNTTQYIDTGYVMTDTTGIKIEVDDTATNSLYGGMAAYFVGAQSDSMYQGYFTRYSGDVLHSIWAWNGEGALDSNIQSTHSTVYINYMNDRKYTYRNGTDTYSRSNDLPTLINTTVSTYLFAIHMRNNSAQYFAKGKIYSVQFTEGSEIVHNFVPAKNSSNVVGMYDTVSGIFFENDGSGTFIAGPPVNNNVYIPQNQ